jgi:hypothetical protein
MAEDQAAAELERFLADRADHLLRAAMLLTGSREAGQDLRFRRAGRLQRKLLLLRAEARPAADPAADVDLRDALIRLPLQLPPRQRAVLVCRYWEQLTEAETAELLGWPEGTVKSAASRGLRRWSGSPRASGRRPGWPARPAGSVGGGVRTSSAARCSSVPSPRPPP